MLTTSQQHAIDQFAKGLLALGDDALIDTYHQAADDLRAARAEGSDNLCKAHALALATEKAMRDRFPDIEHAIKCGTVNELASIIIHESAVLAAGKAKSFPSRVAGSAYT
jgi:hypothetical protein